MKALGKKRLWIGVIGALLVVCPLAAMAISASAESDDPPGDSPANPPAQVWRTWTPTPNIAGIAIRVVDPPKGAWVQMQWSTWAKKDWYPVEEWSGPLSQDEAGWGAVWYEEKNYGTGPFRWVIFDGNPAAGGQVWGMSLPFYLGYVGSFRLVEVSKGENLSPAGPTLTPDPRMAFYAARGAELKANPQGCSHYAIAGDLLTAKGKPAWGYRLRLTYPNGATEIVNTGGAPNYGPSGFGYLFGRVQVGATYKLEVLPKENDTPISPPVKIVFTQDCNTHLAWVVFQSRY
jgi:hypothetical protein